MAAGHLDANLGKCIDFMRDGVIKQGYKITDIMYHALRRNDPRYVVKSNFGAGVADSVFPDTVTQIYDCPAQQNNNVEMAGAGRRRHRRRRMNTRKATRKNRKSSKKTRRN
jgi:hypothetical protein